MGLAKLRKEAGLTLYGLEALSGVSYQQIWKIEHGIIRAENIRLITAQKLAKALGCEPEDLLPGKADFPVGHQDAPGYPKSDSTASRGPVQGPPPPNSK